MQGESRQSGSKRNYIRRSLGITICFAPGALLIASLGIGFVYSRESRIGNGLAVTGLLIAGFNVYLSFIRPLLYAWRHGSTNGMRKVSGIPLLGTILVVVTGVIGFADWRSTAVALVTLVLDTGGLPWFLLMTWQDRSLWDTE